MDSLILGIESSCDETGAAVVAGGTQVWGEALASSAELQARYGGVVPEMAARQQVQAIVPVIEAALSDAHVEGPALTAVAVTVGPGLLGSLLVGMTAAKALAAAWNKPLIPVNHLEAHLYANAVNGPLVYPGLALLVSGGHTAIWRWDGPDRLVLLGETRDDAAGEALDKGARLLGLPYPGGPALEALAATARSRDDHRLPVARLEAGTYDFSFSGLKTALAQALGRSPDRPEEWAWALQEAVVEALWQRTREAWTRYPVEHLYLAGGVVANRRLRERFEHWTSMVGIQLHLPPLAYCTDNAVMVAAAAAHTGHPADLGIGPRVLFPLGSAAAENI